MKRWRYCIALSAALLAAAFPAHAFVFDLSGPAEIAVATPFTITLSGTLNSVEQLSVLIDYPSALVGMQTPCDPLSSVTFMDSGVTGQVGAVEGLQLDPQYPCLYTAFVTADPFSVSNGAILNVGFESLLKTGSATITFYTCVSETCGDVQQQPGDWSPADWTVRIVAKPGNNVPEPATLWLAGAALIAGALIFRKDSKRS